MYDEHGYGGSDNFSGPVSVSELNFLVKEIFDNIPAFKNIYVEGEVSNFKNHLATGHFYFTLKDDSSSVKAVMFRTYASRVPYKIENGMKVTVKGRVAVFPRDGQYQIYCEEIEPSGIGSLYAAFEQLKAKLFKEGLFAEAHKKPLPPYPKTVGVVTSATGAAVRDIINVLGRRNPAVKVIVYPCLVQGADAPKSIISGINYFNATGSADVLIIGRGGGSIEDLWAFNNEALARVIYSSEIPIISAVGHETDFTISDFVSDVRAPTPSAASEICVPDVTELKALLENRRRHLASLALAITSRSSEKLKRFALSRVLCDPMAYIDEKNMLLLKASEELESAFNRYAEKKQMLLAKNAALLNSLSPLSILSRGYSVVYDLNEKALVSVKSVKVGDQIKAALSDGDITAKVINTEMRGGNDE